MPGTKHDENKPLWYLLPWEPLQALVDLFTLGAKKYAPENWRDGIEYSRIFSALNRHLWAWWRGEKHDPENGQHHLTSVAWCAFVLFWYELYRPDLDNRWKPQEKKEESNERVRLPERSQRITAEPVGDCVCSNPDGCTGSNAGKCYLTVPCRFRRELGSRGRCPI